MTKPTACNEIETTDYFKFTNYVCHWLSMETYHVGKAHRRLG